MDDVVLKADIDESSSLYVSPISRQTYDEQIDGDTLGGERGYFLMRSMRSGPIRLEILAKAASLEAAEALFDLIVGAHRQKVSI